MKHLPFPLYLVTAALLLGAATSTAQTTQTPPRPTTPAAPAPKPPAVVQGTTQLAGDVGAIDKTFTLGKDAEAINFTLHKAEFSVNRVTIGEHVYTPKADQKLLILRYSVHNPQKQDKQYAWNTVKFTVVDAKDVNHVHDNYVGRDGTTDLLDITLKPGQKVGAYAVVAVPAAGPIPKLIVSVNDADGVVRYDLRGKVSPIATPFADPADTSGSTALEEVRIARATYAPLGAFDVKLDAVAFGKDTIGGRTPEEGRRFLVATLSIRNGTGKTANPAEWSYGTFKIRLEDAEGSELPYEDYLYKPTRDEHASGMLRPGDETKFRVYFELPEDLAAKAIRVQEGESRTVVFDVSTVK